MLFKSLLLAAAAGMTLAQRPTNTSICDYYTTALLMNNTAANQYTVLTLVVNTVVIGNYTQPNVGIAVPGILAPGTYNGTAVNLAPYFTGALASSNRGGSAGVAVNFLDGGGAAPLKMNMPANSNTTNQYMLLTHLYEFFGALLGCSEVGMTGFPAYSGAASMYEVHKFMVLTPAEVGYFITQVGMAAASFGVAEADVTAVGMALQSTFDYKCLPQAAVIPAQGAQYQSICTDASCPLLAANDTCAAQAAIAAPMNATTAASSGAASTTAKATGSAASSGASGAPAATSTPKSAGVKTAVSYLGLALVGAAAVYTL